MKAGQYGIESVIAPSFGDIFYLNAMNNRLLSVISHDVPRRPWPDRRLAAHRSAIEGFVTRHCAEESWTRDVTRRIKARRVQGRLNTR
ncbi:hypothetical protein [Pseudomonas typographi]|uniref:hypothetical protein n=1 Tax=Pseudomonas typographi TaxID=2715964 RepID=UPI003084476A